MPCIGMSVIGECCVLSEDGDVSLKHVEDFMVMDNYIYIYIYIYMYSYIQADLRIRG